MRRALAVVVYLLSISLVLAGDAPAQPPAETEIVQQFEAAVPALFSEWLAQRPGVLSEGSKGVLTQEGGWRWFDFTVCKDVEAPSNYRMDVRKTDSLMTPFIGKLVVPVRMTCTNQALHAGVASGKAIDRLIPSCVGQTYDSCLKAGGKVPSSFAKFNGMPPAVANGLTFSVQDETVVLYAWRGGEWKFDKEEPPPLPASKRPTRS